MDESKAFLGRGWSFPPEFSKLTAGVNMLEEEEDIRSSLWILLSTRPGERVLQPKFGCALDELAFEPLTTTLKTYTRDLIETAILYYEARIDLLKLNFTDRTPEGFILIELEYKIRSTNSRYNFVFPFYLNEGVNTNQI